MKTKILSLCMVMGLSSLTLFAGPGKTEKFKVAGNCGMCESRIEKAAKSVEGVSSADWNKESRMIEVSYDSDNTNVEQIQKAIAGAGHDTGLFRAEDATYNKLPACCKYERLSGKHNSGCCDKTSGTTCGDHDHK